MLYGLQKEYNLLKAIIKDNPQGKSFLLSGPEMIGKKTAIITLCDDLIKENIMLAGDMILIDKLEDARSVSIDAIRDLRRWAIIAPPSDKVKIAIINDAHRLTTEAQNAFLKVLEEPNKNIFFVLVTHAPNLLLATIRSRTFSIEAVPISEDDCNTFLDTKNISTEQKKYLLKLAQGRVGVMSNILEDGPTFRKTAELLKQYYSTNAGERLLLNPEIIVLYKDPAMLLCLWTLLLKAQNASPLSIKAIHSAYQDLQPESAVPKLIFERLALLT